MISHLKKKARSRRHHVDTLIHQLKQNPNYIASNKQHEALTPYVNTNKTNFMSFKQKEMICTLISTLLKLVNYFTTSVVASDLAKGMSTYT